MSDDAEVVLVGIVVARVFTTVVGETLVTIVAGGVGEGRSVVREDESADRLVDGS